ncbi:hypothetical protein CHLRE_12g526603v5 [Chlamydomonas reinhardtii]|uniref:holocytochrome-c synthase n=1 Tax=Chlamydomonas reinhardtii TaxID=3055 RepID=A0A2K3D4I1_CHLRE|nr:uncharacterized protein CHLRE_12g526603v5 [Chlamydomonas reinhardtii]PNW75442.1 hypothetical protein CHLRE_12g526603v5 [Chlamydomonas reinhardtii]
MPRVLRSCGRRRSSSSCADGRGGAHQAARVRADGNGRRVQEEVPVGRPTGLKEGRRSRRTFDSGSRASQNHGRLLQAGMNEATWQRVAQWEMLHRGECDTPTVLRFQAKPHDLSRLPAWRPPDRAAGCGAALQQPCLASDTLDCSRWAREVIRLAATWPTRTRRRPARTCNRAMWPRSRH